MITLTEDEKRMVFRLEGRHRYDAIQEIAVFCRYTHTESILGCLLPTLHRLFYWYIISIIPHSKIKTAAMMLKPCGFILKTDFLTFELAS